MKSTLFFLLLPLVALFSRALPAQEVISAAGGNDRTEQTILAWTVGEVATRTLTLPGGLITQGFHQPSLLVLPPESSSGEAAYLPSIAVYPNPTASLLNVAITGKGAADYSILELLDVRGRVISTQQHPDYMPNHQLDLTPLPAASYYLRMARPDGANTQLFTIIKLK